MATKGVVKQGEIPKQDNPKSIPPSKDLVTSTSIVASKNPTIPNEESKKKKEVPDLKHKQDEYFQNLMSNVPGDSFQAESGTSVDKASQKVIDHIVYGHLNISNNRIRKSDMIEENIIEKKLQDAQKLKEELRSKLSNLENRIESLASQKIDNPRSLYSHPVMKQYMEDTAEKKRREALRFIKKMHREKQLFDEKQKQKQIEKERLAEQLAKQQANLDKKAQEENEKTREEGFKQRIQQIRNRQDIRLKQLQEFEEIYNKKFSKDVLHRPMYMRQRKKYFQQESVFRKNQLRGIKEKKKGFLSVASIDFKAHAKKYFETLKRLEAEKKLQREKLFEQMCEKQPQPNIVFESSKLYNSRIENSTFADKQEADELEKANGRKAAEARLKFSEGLKQHQNISISKDKQLEMDILIDKQENPLKYISQTKKKTESERYEEFAQKGQMLRSESPDRSIHRRSPLMKSTSYTSVSKIHNSSLFFKTPVKTEDELIFKDQSKLGFVRQDPGKEREIGKQYLKSIKESIIRHNEIIKSRHKPLPQQSPILSRTLEPQTDRIASDSMSQPDMPERLFTEENDKTVQSEKMRLILPKLTQTRSIPFKPMIKSKSGSQVFMRQSQFENNTNQFLNSNMSMFSSIQQQPLQQQYSVQQPKTNFLFEIRKKYNLDNRKEKWERITEGSVTLPISSKQKILSEASYKFDEDIKRREQLIKFNKSDDLTLKDVQDRQELDEAYFKSIKAKIAFMKLQL